MKKKGYLHISTGKLSGANLVGTMKLCRNRKQVNGINDYGML